MFKHDLTNRPDFLLTSAESLNLIAQVISRPWKPDLLGWMIPHNIARTLMKNAENSLDPSPPPWYT